MKHEQHDVATQSMRAAAPWRERPSQDRAGVTHKVTLHQSEAHGAGQSGEAPVDFYITLNSFPDGRPCEVFTKATHGYQGWCDAICRLMSLLLQHGVPVEAICRQLEHAHFSPCGMVPGLRQGYGGQAGSTFARSFPDYLARWIRGRKSVVSSQMSEAEPKTDGTGAARAEEDA